MPTPVNGIRAARPQNPQSSNGVLNNTNPPPLFADQNRYRQLIDGRSAQKTAKTAVPLPELIEENFEAGVLQSKIPVLVFFTYEGCVTCRVMKPIVEEVSQTYKGKISTFFMDYLKLSAEFKLRWIDKLAGDMIVAIVPTLLLFKNGNLIGKCEAFEEAPGDYIYSGKISRKTIDMNRKRIIHLISKAFRKKK